jgi:hypothetical protein
MFLEDFFIIHVISLYSQVFEFSLKTKQTLVVVDMDLANKILIKVNLYL